MCTDTDPLANPVLAVMGDFSSKLEPQTGFNLAASGLPIAAHYHASEHFTDAWSRTHTWLTFSTCEANGTPKRHILDMSAAQFGFFS